MIFVVLYACFKLQLYWLDLCERFVATRNEAAGKNDKADSKDIAFYAISHLHLYEPSLLPENDFLETQADTS